MRANQRWRYSIPSGSTVEVCQNCGKNPRHLYRNRYEEAPELNPIALSEEKVKRELFPKYLLKMGGMLHVDIGEFMNLDPAWLEPAFHLIPWDEKRLFNKTTFVKYLRRYKVPHRLSFNLGIELLDVPIEKGYAVVQLNFTDDGFVKASIYGKNFEIRIPFVESKYLYHRLMKHFSLPSPISTRQKGKNSRKVKRE